MSSDPLSQFRRGEQTQASPGAANQNKRAAQASTGKKTYEAFDKRGRPSSYLEIRCVLQPSQTPQSRYLMDVVYSADFDDGFTLLYSFMAVEVKGANLKDVRRAVQSSQCEFIQEWHENEFARPGQAEPVITSSNSLPAKNWMTSFPPSGKRRNPAFPAFSPHDVVTP